VKAGLLAKLGGRYEAADIEDALSDVIELTEGNQLFMKDIYCTVLHASAACRSYRSFLHS
jgi:hypothetical protein